MSNGGVSRVGAKTEGVKAPWILLLAGGSGTRFWPASTRDEPKHLLPLLEGGRTLLEATLDRALALTGPDHVFVVTAADQAPAVAAVLAEQLPLEQIIAEPVPRNTAPAIALAMVHLSLRGAGPHDPVVVLPTDAWIDDDAGFKAAIERAMQAAVQHKAIVTLGVPPDRPATGYGYLGLGGPEETEGEGLPVRKVLQFREKPDQRTAETWLASGNFWWNAGIFVFRLGYLWYVMGDLREDLDVAMAVLGACVQQDDEAALAEEYGKLESISIDYAVMEQAPSVLTVPAEVGWSDLGSWDAIARVLGTVPGGVGRAASVVAEESSRNVVYAPGRTVALVGIEDVVVVAQGDAILVARRSRAEDVKAVVNQLREQGREDLL